MVSDTGNDVVERSDSRAAARDARLESLGVIAIIIGAGSVVLYFVPGYEERAWMPGVVAIALGALDIAMKVARRRFAIVGMMLGVVAFSWSFALVLFGSVP